MGLYADLGIRPVINASGTLTRLGGSRMAPEVLAAMADAAASFVHIDELQAKAGAEIARIMGAEAAYVVTGAAAGLSLGTAACVAGQLSLQQAAQIVAKRAKLLRKLQGRASATSGGWLSLR